MVCDLCGIELKQTWGDHQERVWPTCFGGLICDACERDIERAPLPAKAVGILPKRWTGYRHRVNPNHFTILKDESH